MEVVLAGQAYSLPTGTLVGAGAAVLLASYLIIGFISKLLNPKAPPVVPCFPIVGGLIKFLKSPRGMMEENYERFGEVFTLPLPGRNFTFLLGPHSTPYFYKATDDEMSQTEIYKFNVPTFGPGVVYDVEPRIRNEQFKWLGEALKGKKLLSYIPSFVREAREFVAAWGPQGVVDLKDQLGVLTTMTASRTLLGREVREQMFDEVAHLLHVLDEGMMPISVFNPHLPLPQHRARDRARKQLKEIFARVMRERRASGAVEDDLMQVFMDSKYVKAYGGRGTTEEEVTGLLIAALFAGQHTSSITSSWTGYYMIGNRDHYARAVEEQRAVMREFGDELTYDALAKMPVLHNIITEVLRLHPPLLLLLRYARTAFSVTTKDGKQYVIPKGHVVATSPWYAGKLAHVWDAPGQFDPDRFAPGREEDKRIQFGFVGFGGGRHSCMGYNFAYLQIKSIWATLLRNFELELVDPIPQPNYDAMVIGPRDGRVKYTARKLAA